MYEFRSAFRFLHAMSLLTFLSQKPNPLRVFSVFSVNFQSFKDPKFENLKVCKIEKNFNLIALIRRAFVSG